MEVDNTNQAHRRRRQHRKSFTEALKEKYSSLAETENTYSNINFVIPGRSKSRNSGAELGFLRNVSLCNSAVAHAGLPQGGLAMLCPNVVDLDLSNNFLENWEEVFPIFAQLPNLKFVNLSRNNIRLNQNFMQSWKDPLKSVENLVLNSTGLTWKEVVQLSKHLPALKELHVCGNGYQELSHNDLSSLENLECLRLNGNEIQSWRHVWQLRLLPNLHSLILSENPLEDVYYVHDDVSMTNDNNNPCPLHRDGNADENGNRIWDAIQLFVDEVITKALDQVKLLQQQTHEEKINAECKQIIEDILEQVVQQPGTVCSEKCDTTQNKPTVVDDVIIDTSPEQIEIGLNDGEKEKGTSLSNSGDRNLNADLAEDLEANQEISDNRIDSTQLLCDLKTKQNINQSDTQTNNSIEGDCREGKPYCSTSDEGYGDSLSDIKDWRQGVNDCTCAQMREVTGPAKTEQKPFSKLSTLCLSKTKIKDWDHLQAISQFPVLKSLRIKDVDLQSDSSPEDRRSLFLASLPNVTVLNGSEVTATERERAERYFLRFFVDREKQPERYKELERKHGKLKPLVAIDIGAGFQEWATLHFVYQGKRVFTDNIHVTEPVGKLVTHVIKMLFYKGSRKEVKLYHLACGPNHQHEYEEPSLELLHSDALPMSRYNMMDGDEIHIDSRADRNQAMSYLAIKTYLYGRVTNSIFPQF